MIYPNNNVDVVKRLKDDEDFMSLKSGGIIVGMYDDNVKVGGNLSIGNKTEANYIYMYAKEIKGSINIDINSFFKIDTTDENKKDVLKNLDRIIDDLNKQKSVGNELYIFVNKGADSVDFVLSQDQIDKLRTGKAVLFISIYATDRLVRSRLRSAEEVRDKIIQGTKDTVAMVEYNTIMSLVSSCLWNVICLLLIIYLVKGILGSK